MIISDANVDIVERICNLLSITNKLVSLTIDASQFSVRQLLGASKIDNTITTTGFNRFSTTTDTPSGVQQISISKAPKDWSTATSGDKTLLTNIINTINSNAHQLSTDGITKAV